MEMIQFLRHRYLKKILLESAKIPTTSFYLGFSLFFLLVNFQCVRPVLFCSCYFRLMF
nr:MAG TPA: hypothetical protein [Caudoviricetes sp.]